MKTSGTTLHHHHLSFHSLHTDMLRLILLLLPMLDLQNTLFISLSLVVIKNYVATLFSHDVYIVTC